MTTTENQLSTRDRSVLRAVAAGRCVMAGMALLVDGRCCSDQFLGRRLAREGLIAASASTGVAYLTAAGRSVLGIG